MAAKVTVVIAVRNEEQTIRSCISSVLASSLEPTDYEVIIVDGKSTDSTTERVREFPVRIVSNINVSAAAGRNLGISESESDYVAFTDGDCEVSRNWLAELVSAIDNAEENVAGIGGPLLTPSDSSHFQKAIGDAQSTLLGSGRSIQGYLFNHRRKVSSISNSNAIYRRKALREVGGFDERVRKGQDAELNFRLRTKQGYELHYTDKAIVYHHRRRSLRSFAFQSYDYGRGMARISRMHGRVLRWFAPIPTLGIISIVLLLLLSICGKIDVLYPVLVLGLYLGALTLTVLEAFIRNRRWTAIGAVLLIPMQHLLYGLGFARGLVPGGNE